MKRSRSLSLVLMGSLLIGGAQGCSSSTQEEESMSAFTSIDECSQSGMFTTDECVRFAVDASKQNPRYTSLAECEEAFGAGQCKGEGQAATAENSGNNSTEVRQHSGSMWMPMMMGFMAGRMLSGSGVMQGSQPLYRDTKAPGNSSFRTATGDPVTRAAGGKVTNPSQKMKQGLSHNAKPAVSRGGAKSSGGFSGGSKFGGSGS